MKINNKMVMMINFHYTKFSQQKRRSFAYENLPLLLAKFRSSLK